MLLYPDSSGHALKRFCLQVNILGHVRNRSVRLVCEMCYRVLCCMVHKHPGNANYLAKYLDAIQEQLVMKLGAGKVLLEMLRGNLTLLRCDIVSGPMRRGSVRFSVFWACNLSSTLVLLHEHQVVVLMILC